MANSTAQFITADTENPTATAVIVTTPVTVSIGPIPANKQSLADIMSYGISGFDQFIATFGLGQMVDYQRKNMILNFAQSQSDVITMRGDGTAISVRRAEREGTQIFISIDNGQSFKLAANFASETLAQGYVNAWISGLV